jgi:hypothetical protein
VANLGAISQKQRDVPVQLAALISVLASNNFESAEDASSHGLDNLCSTHDVSTRPAHAVHLPHDLIFHGLYQANLKTPNEETLKIIHEVLGVDHTRGPRFLSFLMECSRCFRRR